MSTVDVRSDFSHRQRARGNITTESLDIVANKTDGTDSGTMAVSAFAFEFDTNQLSPFLVRTFFYRHVNVLRPSTMTLEYRPHDTRIGIENRDNPPV